MALRFLPQNSHWSMEASPLPENLPHVWRQRAEQLRDWGGSARVARMWERAAVELEHALTAAGGEVLTLKQAAAVSGLGTGYLGDLLRAGRIPNAGRKGAPRIRRADLPVATGCKPVPPRKRGWSRSQITSIASRLR